MRRTEVIEQIKDIIRHVAPTAKTILYGSQARNEACSDSDIDLLILLDGEKITLKEEEAITLPLYELELKTGISISPMVMLKKLWENRPFKTPFYIMKDILDEESRKALIAYRMQRAYDTMKEAEVMIRETFYNAAINRMYYACYYATVALLLKNNIQTQTHNGVKTMLGLHFVSTGKLPLRIGKTFTTLFEKRHSGDYDDFMFCDKEMVDELFPQAELFIKSVDELLKE